GGRPKLRRIELKLRLAAPAAPGIRARRVLSGWVKPVKRSRPFLLRTHAIQELPATDIDAVAGENRGASGTGGQRIDVNSLFLVAQLKQYRFACIVADKQMSSRQANAR